MSKKYVYLFSEGDASMRELLGGKGANLAEMTNNNGTLYKSLIDGNTYSPEVYPAGWEIYAE